MKRGLVLEKLDLALRVSFNQQFGGRGTLAWLRKIEWLVACQAKPGRNPET